MRPELSTNSETGKEVKDTGLALLTNSETGISRLSGAGSLGIERASLSLSSLVYTTLYTP